MYTILNMLPYALLLLAAVVSLFIKGGNIVNKILAFLVFGAGMFVTFAESGGRSCLYSRYQNNHQR